MHTLKASIDGHYIKLDSANVQPVGGTVDHYELEFTSTGEFAGYECRTTWRCGRRGNVTTEGVGGTIPWEVLPSDGGDLYVSVAGYDEDGTEVVRTVKDGEHIEVLPCGDDMGAEARTATDDLVKQLRDEVAEAEAAIPDLEAARDAATSAASSATSAAQAAMYLPKATANPQHVVLPFNKCNNTKLRVRVVW